MKRKEVEQRVETMINSLMEPGRYELVDVEFAKEGPHRYLRIFMDKEGGLTLEDCQKISEILSEPLDREDFIDEAYFLEISSPGLDRPIKKDEDYHRFSGENIEVKLYEALDGIKTFEGELISLKDGVVTLKLHNDELVEIEREKIANAKLAVIV